MTRNDISRLIDSLGIDAWGVVRLGPVSNVHSEYLSQWLSESKNAGMQYLSRNNEVRTNPTEGILQDAKSAIICAFSYFPIRLQSPEAPQISKYAYGKDYHVVVKEILEKLAQQIHSIEPHSYRVIVDTVPFLERYWAEQAGIGFIGKNKNVIIPHKGSFFFLGEILTSLDLEQDKPMLPNCGECRRCIDACPTGALTEVGLDARKCISYLTIEHRGDISTNLSSKFGHRLYGCDTCQDVCPYNHKPLLQTHFPASPSILSLERADLQDLSPEKYKALFGKSATSRAKYSDMLRNAHIWLSNNPIID